MNSLFRSLLAKMAELPRVLRIMLAVLAFDVLVALIVFVEFDDVVSDRLETLNRLHSRLDRSRAEIGAIRGEIARLPELRRTYDTAIAKGTTGPKDRLRLVQMAQEASGRLHLSQLHYRLDADQIEASNPAASNYRLSRTGVNFESGALLDSQAEEFWNEMLAGLSAHYVVTEASLERTGSVDAAALRAIRAGTAVSLVKTKLAFDWVSLVPPGKDEPH